ncbi:MAG: hypothetical protein KIS79_13040 [Burkholderiales bacterium]|nr:hypothetical protein [Burkholderiales bacterium]
MLALTPDLPAGSPWKGRYYNHSMACIPARDASALSLQAIIRIGGAGSEEAASARSD